MSDPTPIYDKFEARAKEWDERSSAGKPPGGQWIDDLICEQLSAIYQLERDRARLAEALRWIADHQATEVGSAYLECVLHARAALASLEGK